MDRPALHPRQASILAFIADELDRVGIPPTIREIGQAAGISSTNVVVYHLDRLAIRGLIVRDERAGARGIIMTSSGYRALGHPDPVADAALGQALRLAAQRSSVAAGVLAELEVA